MNKSNSYCEGRSCGMKLIWKIWSWGCWFHSYVFVVWDYSSIVCYNGTPPLVYSTFFEFAKKVSKVLYWFGSGSSVVLSPFATTKYMKNKVECGVGLGERFKFVRLKIQVFHRKFEFFVIPIITCYIWLAQLFLYFLAHWLLEYSHSVSSSNIWII